MTKVDLCNRALGVLGHDRTIDSFDEESTEALRCRQFFDVALEEVLGAHDWDFAAVEQPYTLKAADSNGWARLPHIEDCLRIVRVTDSSAHALQVRRMRDFMLIKLGIGDTATIRYISKDIDVETLPPKFREAFVYQFAALLCAPMFGSDSKTEGFTNLAKMKLAEAISADADETSSPGDWENPFLAARR